MLCSGMQVLVLRMLTMALPCTLGIHTLPPARAGAIRTAFEFFSQRAASGFAVPEWLPTPGNAAYAAAVRRLDAAVYGIIDRRAAELAAAPMQAPQARCLSSPRHTGLQAFCIRLRLMQILARGSRQLCWDRQRRCCAAARLHERYGVCFCGLRS